MIIGLENLQAGLRWWRQSKWPPDLHNTDYYDMYRCRSAGVTGEWWVATVDRLSAWRATRPIAKADIRRRGESVLDQLAEHYAKRCANSGGEPSITDLDWGAVEPGFSLAAALEPGSTMFASKMSHFLLPKVFFVMDNWATGIFDYGFCWRELKDEWARFQYKVQARKLLLDAVHSQSLMALHPWYPVETKLMELSLIGRKHAGASA